MKKWTGATLFALGLALSVSGIGVQKQNAKADEIAKNGNKIVVMQQENDEIYAGNAAIDLHIRAKSSYLCDYATGTLIYAQNETAHLPIASMCKIMTLILSFEAIDEGVIRMDEEITVSERAASMGGSQVFLEANAKYPVKELI